MADISIPQLREQVGISPEINTGGASSGGGAGTVWNWGINNTAGKADPNVFLFNAIVMFLYVIGLVIVLTFIWAGVKYITSGGDSEKAESAKKIIYGSLIGMLIILGSLALFSFSVRALNSPTQNIQEAQQLMGTP